MASLLFPFSAIIPNSFILPSQPDSSSPSLPPSLLAATSAAAPSAAGPMTGGKAPLVPPGFGILRPTNIHPQAQLNRPNLLGNGNAAGSSSMSGQTHEAMCKAMLAQIRILANGFDTMQKEVEKLKRRSGDQGGLITGLKDEERAFEESKKAIGELEENVGLLIGHAQERERAISELEDKVMIVEGQNRELRKDVGNLKGEIGEFRRMFRKVCVGASIIGGVVFVGGAIALMKNK